MYKAQTKNKSAVRSEVPCVPQWRNNLRHNCLIQQHKNEVELEKLTEERRELEEFVEPLNRKQF